MPLPGSPWTSKPRCMRVTRARCSSAVKVTSTSVALLGFDGDYLMFAMGGVFSPDQYGEVLGQAEAVSDALSPWDAGTRYLNFEEDKVDARLFFDEDAWRALRALRTHWDPKGMFLANHEIKDS
jgi:hypothetical protein